MFDDGISAKAAAKLAGVSESTIRHNKNLQSIKDGGRRLFSRADVLREYCGAAWTEPVCEKCGQSLDYTQEASETLCYDCKLKQRKCKDCGEILPPGKYSYACTSRQCMSAGRCKKCGRMVGTKDNDGVCHHCRLDGPPKCSNCGQKPAIRDGLCEDCEPNYERCDCGKHKLIGDECPGCSPPQKPIEIVGGDCANCERVAHQEAELKIAVEQIQEYKRREKKIYGYDAFCEALWTKLRLQYYTAPKQLPAPQTVHEMLHEEEVVYLRERCQALQEALDKKSKPVFSKADHGDIMAALAAAEDKNEALEKENERLKAEAAKRQIGSGEKLAALAQRGLARSIFVGQSKRK